MVTAINFSDSYTKKLKPNQNINKPDQIEPKVMHRNYKIGFSLNFSWMEKKSRAREAP